MVKAVVSLAQIKKIDYILNHKFMESDNYSSNYYYLHLTYPPRYFVSILKPDLGCDDGYIRSWERVENFMFFRNDLINNDEFFRLFLFGNTVLRFKLDRTSGFVGRRWEESEGIFIKILQEFKGTIDCNVI